jgi:hypothetical protein
VNVIYLMPVYPVGVYKSINSPYCIRSFDSVGTEYGTLTDLRNLVDGAHSRNMAVILDWVVNQTSWDHPWITQHPDWYLQDASGNIEALSGYSDVAALNFSSDGHAKRHDLCDEIVGLQSQYRRLPLRLCRQSADRFLAADDRYAAQYHQPSAVAAGGRYPFGQLRGRLRL